MSASGRTRAYAYGVSGRHIAISAGVVIAIACASIVTTAAGTATDQTTKTKECGHKRLYGHSLTIKVRGKPLACKKVRRIVSGRCDPDGEPWFCFSFWVPGPPLAWIRSEERFERNWSTVITASRYPCGKVGAIAEEWAGPSNEFPTRKQIVADDLIRCDLLKGMNVDQVRQLLGKPDYRSNGGRFRGYSIGLQRDSFFQVDSEVLSLRFSKSGKFRDARIYQS